MICFCHGLTLLALRIVLAINQVALLSDDAVVPSPKAYEEHSASAAGVTPRPLLLAIKTPEQHKDGLWSQGDSSGRIVSQGYYRQGLRQGKWSRSFAGGEAPMFATEWFHDFEPPFLSEAEFVDGVLEGAWNISDARGRRAVCWHFSAGQPHGKLTWWDASGIRRQAAEFQQGRLEGKFRRWDFQGRLVAEQEFVFGRLFRREAHWHTSTQLAAEGLVLLPGEVVENRFDWAAGSAETVVLEVDPLPRRHGVWTWWYANGQKRLEGTYEQGLSSSTFTWWYENGQKQQQLQYVAGVARGNRRTWTREGRFTGSGEPLLGRRLYEQLPAQTLRVEHVQP